MFNIRQRFIRTLALAALFTIPLVPLQRAMAGFILGGGEDYALLFQGAGNNTLQVTNVTVNGNVGVGGMGIFQDGGPSTITGRVDFSDTVTSRFHSNNGANTYNGGQHSPPYMGSFGVAAVTSALNTINSLSQMLLGDAGTSVAINGIQTINASSGAVFTVNGQTVHVFDATSFNNNGTSDVLTINGSASDLVAINLDGLGNIQFHGGIAFTGGIGADNVVFNLGGGNYGTHTGADSLDINNNGGAAGIARGIFLDPNGAISVVNAVVEGRVFGGDAHDFQYVSGSTITMPPPTVPDGGSAVALLGIALAGIEGARRLIHPRKA
jgi:VPDSG-CTERM motif